MKEVTSSSSRFSGMYYVSAGGWGCATTKALKEKVQLTPTQNDQLQAQNSVSFSQPAILMQGSLSGSVIIEKQAITNE